MAIPASTLPLRLRKKLEPNTMSRDGIISHNPITDFVRNRGHELKRSGENFVSRGCPVTQHKRGHLPLSINVEKQVWFCNDCKVGGTVIDWVKHENNCSPAEALRIL